jgi:hypothetical protein
VRDRRARARGIRGVAAGTRAVEPELGAPHGRVQRDDGQPGRRRGRAARGEEHDEREQRATHHSPGYADGGPEPAVGDVVSI